MKINNMEMPLLQLPMEQLFNQVVVMSPVDLLVMIILEGLLPPEEMPVQEAPMRLILLKIGVAISLRPRLLNLHPKMEILMPIEPLDTTSWVSIFLAL